MWADGEKVTLPFDSLELAVDAKVDESAQGAFEIVVERLKSGTTEIDFKSCTFTLES